MKSCPYLYAVFWRKYDGSRWELLFVLETYERALEYVGRMKEADQQLGFDQHAGSLYRVSKYVFDEQEEG